MPSFASIKFGLEMAGLFLAAVCTLLAIYWKLDEDRLNKERTRT